MSVILKIREKIIKMSGYQEEKNEAGARLKNPTLENNVCKLLLGTNLTEEEISLLAHYSEEEIAEVAINVTSNKLKFLNDPYAILRATAIIYGQITNKLEYTSKPQKPEIFHANLQAIRTKRGMYSQYANTQEKGPLR